MLTWIKSLVSQYCSRVTLHHSLGILQFCLKTVVVFWVHWCDAKTVSSSWPPSWELQFPIIQCKRNLFPGHPGQPANWTDKQYGVNRQGTDQYGIVWNGIFRLKRASRSPLLGACNSHNKQMQRHFYRPVFF